MKKNILITGGAGFIGSCFALEMVNLGHNIVVLDKLTYAGNLENLKDVFDSESYQFIKGDILDKNLVQEILQKNQIDWLVNFAAESHVDNSISSPEIFIETNIKGAFNLLNQALIHYRNLSGNKKDNFRFLHISTDEVYGSLSLTDPKFNEENSYKPNSPYSASKAASDHLVRAWFETYNLPCITTNCSNNFGYRQHKEKLIPTVISKAISGQNIPIYGNGKNIRDWIFVEDHCQGIYLALTDGKTGETYCFGGDCEFENIVIAKKICAILDEIKPLDSKKSYTEQINFVEDRLGHDKRYAINNAKAERELKFKIDGNFDDKLRKTVKWYLSTIKKIN